MYVKFRYDENCNVSLLPINQYLLIFRANTDHSVNLLTHAHRELVKHASNCASRNTNLVVLEPSRHAYLK